MSSVNIFPTPTAGEYVSVGAWTNGGEWHSAGWPDSTDGKQKFTQVIGTAAQQPVIRYSSAGQYEVRLPGEGFEQLLQSSSSGGVALQHNRFLYLQGGPAKGYQYSELAHWWRPDLDFAFTADFGTFAFGLATPAGSVPMSGTATYDGLVRGFSDSITPSGTGQYFYDPVEGTVRLAFDFGAGTLSGNMKIILNQGMSFADLGTFDFSQVVFAKGSTTYSGDFITSAPGKNYFNGRFTGPNAEETIGTWALPFKLNGQDHQALGAWIAKRAGGS